MTHMALMLGRLYDALRTAQGIGETQAREAAEEVAGYEQALADVRADLRLLKWMVGTNVVFTGGILLRLLSQP
jgi:hypothetical protein